jgi:hypothetical protein
MAKQSGPIKITGTVHGITFYKLEGEYLARQKSSLTASRVKKDPAFANMRKESKLMALASPLASKVYRQLEARRKRRHYQLLTGRAQVLLRKGLVEETVTRQLFEWAQKEWGLKNKEL